MSGGGPSHLSERAGALLRQPPMPAYLDEHFARRAAGFDAHGRSYIPLCVAENRLVFDLLAPRANAVRRVGAETFAYDDMTGSAALKRALGHTLGRTFLGRTPPAEELVVLNGAGSILELLFYALADPGDAVLVPTPSYAGFWADLETRNGLHILQVPTASSEGFRLRPDSLDQALAAANRPVRALLFTSPDNPQGRVYRAEEIESILRWAEARHLHLVADEVYALSVFGEVPFTSCARLRPQLGSNLHVVWAFSKDFAASGLRCGVLWSENAKVRQAIGALSYWACCSGDTQAWLADLLADDAWVDRYIATMQQRLGAASARTTAALAAAGLPFLPGAAGFFFLLDLRRHLAAPTFAAEEDLWRHLLAVTNVNLTPGAALRSSEPGFFRLCFAAVAPELAEEGIRRLAAALGSVDG